MKLINCTYYKLGLSIVFLFILLASCRSNNGNDKTSFPEKIEAAHNKQAFIQKEAISFDFLLYYRGKKHLVATYTVLPDLSKIRMELDSAVVIYDGKNAYQSPSDAQIRGARFNLFTWPYFFSMPYKLTDPGTNWQKAEPDSLMGSAFKTQKLTFDEGVGDTPDDWYIVFADPENYRLKAASYIVTFFQSKQKAEEDPHAITYDKFKMVDGIPIATDWRVYIWREDTGLGEQIEQATLSNIRFVNYDPEMFQKPDNSSVVEQPK